MKKVATEIKNTVFESKQNIYSLRISIWAWEVIRREKICIHMKEKTWGKEDRFKHVYIARTDVQSRWKLAKILSKMEMKALMLQILRVDISG